MSVNQAMTSVGAMATTLQYFFQTIEEGRAASKSPHQKFGYYLFISQQAVSADITKNSAVGNYAIFES
jgi:hypothetical protein